MNRKIWFSGGEPAINIDDIMRDARANLRAITRTFNAWLTGFNQNFIISGCELTITAGVEASVTEGYIFLNGEVLRVDAQTTAFGTLDEYHFEKQTTFDPNGDKTYNDAVFRQTWEVNRGILLPSPSIPVPSNQLDAKGNTLAGKILETIRGKFLEIIASSATIEAEVNYLKLGINGSGTWILTIPKADDPTVTHDVNFINVYEQTPNTPTGIFEVRDTDGTLIRTFDEPEFAIIVNDSGVWKDLIRLPTGEPAPTNPLLIEIDIPSWNMNGSPNITIAHGQTNKDVIKTVFARIINDDGDELFDLTSGGGVSWDDTLVNLLRDTGSVFDSNDFNGTGFNRGKIYIQL